MSDVSDRRSLIPSRPPFRRSGAALLAVLGLIIAMSAAAPARDRERGVSVAPVVFHVTNSNRSAVPCPSDGKPYDITGHLVTPAKGTPDGVTLYLHGLGHGEWLWNLGSASVNHAAQMARAGHASVVIDRLGYDRSGHPDGLQSCVGAQADIAAQIVRALRAGSYDTGAGRAHEFGKVALVGLSAGGMIAEIEAYSFGGIDALGVLSYADQGPSQATLAGLAQSGGVCLTGGQHAETGGAVPGGYAYFGQTAGDFQALMFHDVDPSVAEAATGLRNRDPCGDLGSLAGGIAADQLMLRTIALPVFVGCGRDDAIFPPPACDAQAGHYTGSPKVTTLSLDGTGHMLPLERTAPAFRVALGAWLSEQGL